MPIPCEVRRPMKIHPLKPQQILTPPSAAKTEKARGVKTAGAAAGDTAGAAAQTAARTGDNFQTEAKQKIMHALQNEPEARPDVVARAKALAADDSYPGDDVLAHVAKVFVKGAAKQK